MKIQVLRSSMEDLTADRKFYDRQETGVGDYFFDSLFSEIDSLALYGGIHSVYFGFYRLLAKRFPYATYTTSRMTRLSFSAFLIADVTQINIETRLKPSRVNGM